MSRIKRNVFLGVMLACALGLALCSCQEKNNAEEPINMKEKLPALRALIAANCKINFSEPVKKQQDEAYLIGVAQGVYSTFTMWNLMEPGAFRQPKDWDLPDILKLINESAIQQPSLLDMSPGDFIMGVMFQFYGSESLKQRALHRANK